MNHFYSYIISNGHHIAVIDGHNFVIDTGSPISFPLINDLHSVNINGMETPLSKNLMGIRKSKIRYRRLRCLCIKGNH